MSYILHQCDCGSVIKVDLILYEMLPEHALADYLNDLCWKRCDGDFAPVFGIYDTETDISSEDYVSLRFAEGVHGDAYEYARDIDKTEEEEEEGYAGYESGSEETDYVTDTGMGEDDEEHEGER